MARIRLCVAVGLVLFAAPAPYLAAAPERPNILLALADDWGWPHAGVYGDKVVQTPTFDRLARDGVRFNQAFVTAPSCTASRGGILTGLPVHRLQEGGDLWSLLPSRFRTYPDLLEETGYVVGHTRKGWGPGTLEGSGRTRNPAGPAFKDFRLFLQSVPAGKPFCFWFGSRDPHRAYVKDSGVKSGMKPDGVVVPPWLPDTPTVRSDLLDYYFAVQRFDRELGEIIALLEQTGRLDNTLVVITGDNGIPFPRAKATLYDGGTRVPLAVYWKSRIRGGRVLDDLISLADLAPTFLEAAGQKPRPEMTARSFLATLLSDKSGRVDPTRDKVFTERERHAWCRADGSAYPIRALRTYEYLYVRNFRPSLWPAGEPELDASQGSFGDIDASPSKAELLQRRAEPSFAPFFKMACEKRPAEELYDLSKDPGQLTNVAGRPEHADAQRKLRAELDRWMAETGDPRAKGETDFWDKCPYTGKKPGAR